MRAIASSLLLLALAACGGSEDDAIPPADYFGDPPPLWNSYVIGYGETLNLAENVSVNFTAVVEDSRCPTGVQCISAGNASVILTTSTLRGTSSMQLNTNPSLPDSALFDYYGAELRGLTPYPVVDPQTGESRIPINAYEATVFVYKAATPP